ncbi:MAG: amylo-alpha-1,6-glucosidase [Culicoidibacterales bacterium]
MELQYTLGRGAWRTLAEGNEKEWLITNGIGGFAGHTVSGGGFRSFHAYLVAAFNAPVERYTILTRTQEQLTICGREYDLTSQQYVNDAKNGQEYLQRFCLNAVPQYTYQVEDIQIKKTIALEHKKNTVVICYEIHNGMHPAEFNIVPLLNYRPSGEYSERADLQFDIHIDGQTLTARPAANPTRAIQLFASEGSFLDRQLRPTSAATPNYLIEENHYYEFDNRNGGRALDNHYTPYDIRVNLEPFAHKRFYLKCTVETLDTRDGFEIVAAANAHAKNLMTQSALTDSFALNLVKAADNFIVDRKSTGLKTVLAGYPWFADWGRDTMIAFEGLTLSTKRFDDAREILESFVRYIKNGLVPNVFPDTGSDPQYNTVDASLWYIQAVYQYLQYTGTQQDYDFVQTTLYAKMIEIMQAYSTATDFSIRMDDDGLICAGSGLDQVTWMDVRVGEIVVTPRHGKPVEINALWYNALKIMAELARKFGDVPDTYLELAEQVKTSFTTKFWNEATQCLYDVVDADDPSIRPNQIWAVSLPFTMLSAEQEQKIVQTVYSKLYATYGLRSLSFDDPRFRPQYLGPLLSRDLSYHMGTTWGFPIGAFISAYCKVYEYQPHAIQRAKEMCDVFADHLQDGCLNGIAEIFDGDFTATSRGCFTQAWSVSEVLRAYVSDVLPYLPEHN